MPLIINQLPKQEDKVITMGKADYYPPGATEPQVRPDNVPAEVGSGLDNLSASLGVFQEKLVKAAEEQPKAEPKKVAKKK